MSKRTTTELVALLERSTQTPVPPADPVFVAQLERRLRVMDLSTAARTRRPVRRGATLGIVAAIAVAGAAAAAAGVVTLRANDHPATTTSMPLATTTSVATTLPPGTAVETTTAAAPTPVAAPVVSLTPATTAAPSTVAATTAPPTEPPTTAAAPATSSTEVRTAATLTINCVAGTGGVDCTWTAGPDGTTHYALLRSDASGSPGRAFVVDAATTAYTDSTAVAGTTYQYLVHALDANEQSLAHSDHIGVPCC